VSVCGGARLSSFEIVQRLNGNLQASDVAPAITKLG
jgi:hypothetical protein